ncbi:hypothetical protein LU11_gp195 [Pseudomonas phage Lu11]|uniref:hypothetical protein n=1 Tax=Pseudomonas phage Lu11 TaxID=1161927 RepID=UPI00025F17E9|nr:hypothetical protein LU11_gp195 [Pseudomonas phage Lu11]AFH14726.1 hypothetical protein Lu11_0189 [Pseudomonas phage Lu11]
MASPEYVRTFLSGELLVGNRRSDPHGIRWAKERIPQKHKAGMQRQIGRYLSDEPSNYLR